jgi:hypothetical protein
LKSGIVSGAEFLLKKHHQNLKNTQMPAHLSLNPFNRINLTDNNLRRWICFRAPREISKTKNVAKWKAASHPKAESGSGKLKLKWLGLENGLSSFFYPVRTPGRMTLSQSENRVYLTHFRIYLLQVIINAGLNFRESKFALLS